MHKRFIVAGVRTFFGLLSFYVIGSLIITLNGNQQFNAVNFFSYFTNLSNILAASVLIVSSGFLITKRKASITDDIIRGAAVLYMAVTGIIYATLLSGEDLGLLSPFNNFVLHYLMPVIIVVDWIYQPQRSTFSAKQTLWWLLFPLVYLAYSLTRGAYVDWYPYPFLNPAKVGGYDAVALYCLAVLGLFLLLSFGLRKLGTRLPRHIR